MTMKPVSPKFAKRIASLHGGRGTEWLFQLPALLAECSERWSLAVLPPFEPLSYNYVAPAVREDGAELVLKAGVPGQEVWVEIGTLSLYNGVGMVRMLESDPARGVMLLELLKPGTMLSEDLDDQRATSVATGLMGMLRRTAPSEHAFPTVGEWGAGFERLRARFDCGTGPLPADLVQMAETTFRDLVESSGNQVVLHGDLHHENILSAQRGQWLAIDPKGVIGEPEYEAGAFLRNPVDRLLKEPQLVQLLSRRADQIVEELGFDRQRVVGWAFAQAVLAAWWSYEDHEEGWEPMIAIAAALIGRR